MKVFMDVIKGAVDPVIKKLEYYKNRSKIVQENGGDRTLYETKDGNRFWLNTSNYLDREIISTGVWEVDSTHVVKKLVKEGDVVLDIGANIGYYSVLISKIVGNKGKVIAFEPTKFFGDVLKKNLEANGINNCIIENYALSDAYGEETIFLGDDSATINWANDESKKTGSEIILKKRLDDVISELPIERIDFIKIDVDGHEPAFLRGAIKTIKEYKPVILLEFAHLNYLEAGVFAWDFYDYLKDNGMHIYYENDLSECVSKRDFLVKCANFAYSSNIVISEKELQ